MAVNERSGKKKRRKEPQSELKLSTKTHSIYAYVAFALALLSVFLFMGAVITSATYGMEQMGVILTIGFFALVGIMTNLSGVIYGIMALMMKDYYRSLAAFSLCLHGIMAVAYGAVIYFGYL